MAGLVEQLEEANWIDPAQAAVARRIDGLLDLTSGRESASLWEPEALCVVRQEDWVGGGEIDVTHLTISPP